MRLKAVKRKNRPPAAVSILLLAAVAAGLLGIGSDSLSPAGETAAVFSAALNMPDGGLKLLADRFRSALYTAPEGAAEAPGEDAASPTVEPKDAEEPEFIEKAPQQAPALEPPVKIPKIPAQYKAELISEDFSGHNNKSLLKSGAGLIKNDTKESDAELSEILETGFDLGLRQTREPQVLLLHTHATESFERYDTGAYDTRNTWRSTDNNSNMAAVGNAMREILEQNGIGVIHDTTQHDYPSYNGSYERSAETVKRYLAEYPSIKIVLDLHRDAMERENQAIVKPVAQIDGKKAAQVMIISGCDDGTMNMQNWRENLRFAAALENKASLMYPGLMRPLYLCYRKYNMDLSRGSLLLEFGSNASTLDEAVYSARMIAGALSELIKENTADE